MGIYRVEDLIRYYPRGFEIYEDPVPISEVEEGKINTIAGSVFGRIAVSVNRSMQITTLNLKDLTGTIKVLWFRMPFLRTTLGKGGTLILRGRVVRKRDRLVMEHPEIFYPASKYDEKRYSMQPVYPLTAGLTNNTVIKAVRQSLEAVDDSLDILPAGLAEKYGFLPYSEAVRRMHFPEDKDAFIRARERFVYEEFLVFILSLRRMKASENRAENHFKLEDRPEIDQFLETLPYDLTDAQMKVWGEIKRDMQSNHVMSRLVQGDVGSGKTIVAFLGLLLAGLNGYQGALMAPTEVLAKQHYENISEMLERYRDDKRIMNISGVNSLLSKPKLSESYYFSRYPHIWGWATWRRAWHCYSPQMEDFPDFVRSGALSATFPDRTERKRWTEILEKVYRGDPAFNTWDAQWSYAHFKNHALSITPRHNLVINIGCTPDAMHTADSPFARIPAIPMEFPLCHPNFIVPNMKLDAETFREDYANPFHRRLGRWLARKLH